MESQVKVHDGGTFCHLELQKDGHGLPNPGLRHIPENIKSQMDFYIDESGNTGDLSRTNAQLTFGGQPVFSLIAVGLDDESELAEEFAALRKKHNVQADELKLNRLLKRQPRFALDAVELVVKNKHPLFIEIVDKKYQLAISMTTGLVMPSVFASTNNEKGAYILNVFADYIYHKFSNDLFFAFTQAMNGASNEKTDQLFDTVIAATKSMKDEVGKALTTMLVASKDDLMALSEFPGQDAYKHFLPIPDIGKRDQEVWLLPNFSSFTNIYARINLHCKSKLSNIRFIHDTQTHFDQITEDAKAQIEGIDAKTIGYHPPYSDYNLVENAKLFFRRSHDSAGIQLADIVAGLSMRWYLSHLGDQQAEASVLEEAMSILYGHSDARIGTGINLVAPPFKGNRIVWHTSCLVSVRMLQAD